MTLPRLGRSRLATLATAWIIALSRSSLIRGSSRRSVSLVRVKNFSIAEYTTLHDYFATVVKTSDLVGDS